MANLSKPHRAAGLYREGGAPGDAITRYYLAFRTALLRQMRVRLDETDAEDVVQEIFLKAWRDISRYDATRSSPRTWLSRIGDQIQARHFRSYFRRQRAEEANLGNGHQTPMTAEERHDLRHLLALLLPLDHRIISARFLLEQSMEEIAAELDLSKEVVRQRIARSLKRLRKAASRREPRFGLEE